MSSCITELLSQGNPVKIDGLGTFVPTVESTKEGITIAVKALVGPLAVILVRLQPASKARWSQTESSQARAKSDTRKIICGF